MTRPNSYQTDLDPQAESELMKRLTDQANRVAVSPELLDGVEQRHRSTVRRRRTVSRVALAGSVVGVVVTAFGLLQVGGSALDDDSNVNLAEPASALGFCGGAEALIMSAHELIIWLDVGVAPAAVGLISDKLAASSEVAAFSYMGPQETYQEFEFYFADEPEILELVEAEQMPTSFRVQLVEETQATPVGLAWVEKALGVDQVEHASNTCTKPVLGD